MSADPIIQCSVELTPIPMALLRELGQKELGRNYGGGPTLTARFRLCAVCLFPNWSSSGTGGAEQGTIVAEFDEAGRLCDKCEKFRYEHPLLFDWVSYVFRMRGVL